MEPTKCEDLPELMKYLCDESRHLVCVPYSVENLHKMAEDLGIKRCFFHKDHYDIPKRKIAEITAKCELVTSQEIVRVIRGIAGCSALSTRFPHGQDVAVDSLVV